MKIRKLLPLLALASFNACTIDTADDDPVHELTSIEVTTQKPIHVCLDQSVIRPATENRSAKALKIEKLWENGQTLKVKFLSGDPEMQERIWEQAIKWEAYANITFELVTTGDADIRINIDDSNASWSYIGNDAAIIGQDDATMNFGWFFDYTSDLEIQRTTLHEFGHALGAIHEHQSPAAAIQWDEDYVIDYYMENFDWTEARVRSNLFTKYDQFQITNSVYDPSSIMHYPVNAAFTLDNFSVSYNYFLSDLDKSFMQETYPFAASPPVNLALGKVAQQLSTAYSGEASRALDGNTSGAWGDGSVTHTNVEERPWWQVRLGAEFGLGVINIYNRTNDCCKSRLANFDVFVYNDAGENVFKTTIVETPDPMISINAEGAVGSRVRIKLKDTNALSLAEVEVFEY